MIVSDPIFTKLNFLDSVLYRLSIQNFMKFRQTS